jgi:hypothetical protein
VLLGLWPLQEKGVGGLVGDRAMLGSRRRDKEIARTKTHWPTLLKLDVEQRLPAEKELVSS